MEQAFAGFQKGLAAIINTALKQFADAQSQARRHAIPAIFGLGQGGDPDGKTFGEWLLTVARAGARNVNAAGLVQRRLETVYGSTFNQWETKAALAESAGATIQLLLPAPRSFEPNGLA